MNHSSFRHASSTVLAVATLLVVAGLAAAPAATAAPPPSMVVPPPMHDLITAPEGFAAHIAALEKAHILTVKSGGVNVPLWIVQKVYADARRGQVAHRAKQLPTGNPVSLLPFESQARSTLISHSGTATIGIKPPSSTALGLATPAPGSFIPATPPPATGSTQNVQILNVQELSTGGDCRPAGFQTLCAVFQQAGSIEHLVTDADYTPANYKGEPVSLMVDAKGHPIHAADGQCELNYDGLETIEVPCPGTTVTIELPGCSVNCVDQAAHIAIRDTFAFNSYLKSSDCDAGGFVITVKTGSDDGVSHTLYFDVDRPGLGSDNTEYVCNVYVTITGPSGVDWKV